MKKYLFLLILIVPLSVRSQTVECPVGKVCISQAVADKCANIADEVVAARDAIAKLTSERVLSVAERDAATVAIKALNDVIASKDRVIADMAQMQVMYEKIITLQSTLIEKLTTALNKPKSGWQKFIDVVEKLALLTLGLTIGKGL